MTGRVTVLGTVQRRHNAGQPLAVAFPVKQGAMAAAKSLAEDTGQLLAAARLDLPGSAWNSTGVAPGGVIVGADGQLVFHVKPLGGQEEL